MLNNDSVQPHFAYLQIPMPCLTLIYGSALQFFSGFINPDRSLWHALQTNSRRCWIVLNMEGFWSCRWLSLSHEPCYWWVVKDTNLNSPSLSHQYENQLEHLHHSRWAEVGARRTVEREKAEGAVEGRRRPQSPLCRSSQCQGHSSGHHIGVGRLDEALVTVSE